MVRCTPNIRVWEDPYTNFKFWQISKHQSFRRSVWLPTMNHEAGLSEVTLEIPWDLPSELQSSKSLTMLARTKAQENTCRVEEWMLRAWFSSYIYFRDSYVWLVQFELNWAVICGWNALGAPLEYLCQFSFIQKGSSSCTPTLLQAVNQSTASRDDGGIYFKSASLIQTKTLKCPKAHEAVCVEQQTKMRSLMFIYCSALNCYLSVQIFFKFKYTENEV